MRANLSRARRDARRFVPAAAAILSAFLLWEGWDLCRFISAQSLPPDWDQANHLDVAWAYRAALKQGRWTDIWNFLPKQGIPPFPPLYHLSLVPFLGGGNPDWAPLAANWLPLVLLCAAIAGIAWELRKDDAALAAPLLFAGAPVVQWLLHTQLPDLSLTAWSAAGTWALLRTRDFSRRAESFAFAAVFAVGMLHKWSYFSYLAPAYYVWLRALRDPGRRMNALGSAAFSLALFMPWYAVRLPLVFTRLTAATADYAVPFWKGGAFFQYLTQMPDQLGPPFALLALLGLWSIPRLRRDPASRLVFAGVASSYLFWALVPNRQMRYLLPGLPGIAALCAAACPRRWIWAAAALQIAAAANYGRGFLPEIAVLERPVDVRLFPSSRPRREDWKIEAVLREAVERAGGAATTIVVVANDATFNELAFAWTAHRDGRPNVSISGPNATLWELAPFVVLKDEFRASPVVTGALTSTLALISDQASWFHTAYREARRWPLPDGSHAILFQKRGAAARPFPSRVLRLKEFEWGSLRGTDTRLNFDGWDAREAIYRRIEVSPSELCWRELCLRNLRIELRDALLIPGTSGGGDWHLVRLGSAKLSPVSVPASDLSELLERRGIRIESLILDGTLRVKARIHGFPVEAEVAAESGPERLSFKVRALRLAGVPFSARWLTRFVLNGPVLDVDFHPDSTVLTSALRPGGPRILPFGAVAPAIAFERGTISVR